MLTTFDGTREAKVRDRDTRVRISFNGPAAAHLWRLLSEHLTGRRGRTLTASTLQTYSSAPWIHGGRTADRRVDSTSGQTQAGGGASACAR